MKNKIILLIFVFLLLPITIYAELPALFDCNRFLSETNNTIFEITYKIYHKDLQFKQFENRLSAQINITFLINDKKGKELYKKNYSQLISTEKGKFTVEPDGFFIDKIIAQVYPGTYEFAVDVSDRLSNEKILWKRRLKTLDTENLTISDVEINSFYKSDTTQSFINFKRDNIIFLVNPNHLINPLTTQDFAYYFEVYHLDTIDSQISNWQIKVLSEDDSIFYYKSQDFPIENDKKAFWGSIPVTGWFPGTYKMVVEISDKISTQELLFISELEKEVTDADVEVEYRYVKYFLTRHDNKIYKDLNNKAKLKYIERFWKQNDPNPITEKNEFKDEIIRRHRYADENFAHLKKDGWETDRGRIYIRHGKPGELIEKGYEYKAKPYIIWKYYTGGKRIYVFVDFTGMGNYKLVYSENDEKEFTDPNWLDYLGEYFDKRELE